MSKRTENVICPACDSEYKVTYNDLSVSGLPKFCMFCSEELYFEDEEPEEEQYPGGEDEC